MKICYNFFTFKDAWKMLRIFLGIAILWSFSVKAEEGPVYNFNFYNSDQKTKPNLDLQALEVTDGQQSPKNPEELSISKINESDWEIESRIRVGLGYGTAIIKTDFTDTYYFFPQVSMAFQIVDQLWVNTNYMWGNLENFPGMGLGTKYQQITPQLTYSSSLGYGFHLQVYGGYSFRSMESPQAGLDDDNDFFSPSQLAIERDLIADGNKNKLVLGLGLLFERKGWYAVALGGLDALSFTLGRQF